MTGDARVISDPGVDRAIAVNQRKTRHEETRSGKSRSRSTGLNAVNTMSCGTGSASDSATEIRARRSAVCFRQSALGLGGREIPNRFSVSGSGRRRGCGKRRAERRRPRPDIRGPTPRLPRIMLTAFSTGLPPQSLFSPAPPRATPAAGSVPPHPGAGDEQQRGAEARREHAPLIDGAEDAADVSGGTTKKIDISACKVWIFLVSGIFP